MSTGGLGMKIRAANAFVSLGVQDNLSKGLSKAESKLRDFGQRTASMASKLAGASLAVAGPGLLSAQTFAGFEHTMGRVRGLTNATKEEFTQLREEAKRLGATTSFTARDAARGMAFYAQAGFQVKEIYDSMGPTLDLAAAGQLDVAESADILAKIMKGMGVPASDLTYHVDVLTKAMQTANTDLRQLGDAFKYAGAVSKTAGLSFEETTAFLQMMSNAGIQADMAGTTLRGALLALTSPSKEAQEQLDKLGIDTMDANGNFVSLAEIIGQFEVAMAGMGSGEKLAILGRIFDNRQASGFAEAIAQGGQVLADMTESLRDSSGAAARFRNIQMNTLTGQWLLFTSAVETLQITIGEIVSKPLRSLLRGLTNAVVAAVAFAEANAWVFVLLGVIGGLLLSGAAYFLMLSLAAMGAQAALQLFGFVVSVVRVAIVAVNLSMVALTFTAKAVQLSLVAVGIALLVTRGAIIAADVATKVLWLSVVGLQLALSLLSLAMAGARIAAAAVTGAVIAFYSSSVLLQNTLLVLGFVLRTLRASIVLAAGAMWTMVTTATILEAAFIILVFAVSTLEGWFLALRSAIITAVMSSRIMTASIWLLQAALTAIQTTILIVGYVLYSFRAVAIASAIATGILTTASYLASLGMRFLGVMLVGVRYAMVGLTVAVRGLAIAVAFLGSPWVSLAAVVTTVVLLVQRYMNSWSVTVGDASNQWSVLFEHVKWIMQGIYDAIVAGKWDLAFKILMSGAKLVLTEGLLAVTTMFGGTIETTSKMIAELYKQFMQVVTKLNTWRASASDWLAQRMGDVMGVDVQSSDSAALAAATEWENAINSIDTSRLAESISEALDPETQMQALNDLLGEAAQAADAAFQDPSMGPKGDPRAAGNTPTSNGLIGGTEEAANFASIGNFSAAILSRQLPGAKDKTTQIATNTANTVKEIQKLGMTIGGMGFAFGP